MQTKNIDPDTAAVCFRVVPDCPVAEWLYVRFLQHQQKKLKLGAVIVPKRQHRYSITNAVTTQLRDFPVIMGWEELQEVYVSMCVC